MGPTGSRHIETSQPMAGGLALRSLNLGEYYITQIVYSSSQFPETMEEPYGINDTEQMCAFNALQSIFEEEEGTFRGSIKESSSVSTPQSPKRLEVTLQEIGRQSTKKTLIVTDILSPKGHWNSYSVSGRVWSGSPKKLGKGVEAYWSSSHHLVRVDAYLGGGAGSSSSSFTLSEGVVAWTELERMFNKFTQQEINDIKSWAPEERDSASSEQERGDDDRGAWKGQSYHHTHHTPPARGQHWTNQSPAHYRTNYSPAKAYYRVSGDEAGAELADYQESVWKKENPGRTPGEVLKEILGTSKEVQEEKKVEAGTNKASDTGTGSGETIRFGGRCPECQGLSCFPGRCLQDYDIDSYIGAASLAGKIVVH